MHNLLFLTYQRVFCAGPPGKKTIEYLEATRECPGLARCHHLQNHLAASLDLTLWENGNHVLEKGHGVEESVDIASNISLQAVVKQVNSLLRLLPTFNDKKLFVKKSPLLRLHKIHAFVPLFI